MKNNHVAGWPTSDELFDGCASPTHLKPRHPEGRKLPSAFFSSGAALAPGVAQMSNSVPFAFIRGQYLLRISVVKLLLSRPATCFIDTTPPSQ